MKKIYLFLIAMFYVLILPLNVVSANTGADVRINLINQDPDPVGPSSYVDVRFRLENYGNQPVNNLLFKILPKAPLSLDNPSEAEKQLGGLQGLQYDEEGIIVKYRLRVSQDAIEGQVPIDVAYKEGNDESWRERGPFYINIESSNKVLSVDNYETDPERFKAGKEGKITVRLSNIADADLKDIKVKLSTNAKILPIGNTDEKIVKTLRRAESTEVEFNVIIDSSAATGVYSLPVNITYKDFKNVQYSRSNLLSVLVDNKPEILVNLDNTEIRKAGEKGSITVSISNSGVSEIKFLSYRLVENEDYKILDTPFSYIGNIDSDDFETVDSEIFINEDVENVNLKIELNYKDSFNEDYTVFKEIPLKIYSKEDLIKYGYEVPEQKNTTVLFVVIGVILMIYWLFMFIDLAKRKMVLYKKILWMAILVIGLPLGALLYQFFGKGRGTD
jgi:hypothetical protein